MLTDKVAAVLINTPTTPSGIAYSIKTEKLAEVPRKQKEYGADIFLISDEPTGENCLCRARDAPYPSKFYDNTLSCYSLLQEPEPSGSVSA